MNRKRNTIRLENDIEIVVNQILAEIVASYCHDLNNSLGIIFGFEALIGRPRIDPSKIRKGIQSGVNSMGESLKDLHQLMKVFYSPDNKPQKLITRSNAKSEILELCQPLIGPTIHVRINISKLSYEFVFPRVLLRPLIFPFIQNSVKAIHTSPISLTVHTIYIELRSMLPDKIFRVSIKDNGPGWQENPEDLLQSIIKKAHLTPRKISSGFGLVNVYRIIRGLNGEMKLSNKSPVGASIQVLIPWNNQ